ERPSDQARNPDAAESGGVERPAGSAGIRGVSPMTEQEQLARTWAHAPGFLGWLSETDHKKIGLRYILTALCFFTAAGIEAALMRLQLSRPENTLLNPDLYNQIFTMHG